jgi:hypothetical protein
MSHIPINDTKVANLKAPWFVRRVGKSWNWKYFQLLKVFLLIPIQHDSESFVIKRCDGHTRPERYWKNLRNLGRRSLLCNLGLEQAVTWPRTNAMFSGRVSQFRFPCSGSCVTDSLPRVKERRRIDWPCTYNIPSAADTPLQYRTQYCPWTAEAKDSISGCGGSWGENHASPLLASPPPHLFTLHAIRALIISPCHCEYWN